MIPINKSFIEPLTIIQGKVKLNTDPIPGLAQYTNLKPVSTKEFIENCTRFRNNLIKHNIQLEMPEKFPEKNHIKTINDVMSEEQLQKDINPSNDQMKYCARDYVPGTGNKYCYGKFADLQIVIDVKTGYVNADSICKNGPKNSKGEQIKHYFDWIKNKANKESIIDFLQVEFNFEFNGSKNTEQEAKKLLKENSPLVKQMQVVNSLELSGAKNIKELYSKIPKDMLKNALYEAESGRYISKEISGTYLHPDLIVDLAAWVDIKLRRKVRKIVQDHFKTEYLAENEKLKSLCENSQIKIKKLKGKKENLQSQMERIAAQLNLKMDRQNDTINELKVEILTSNATILQQTNIINEKTDIINEKTNIIKENTDIINEKTNIIKENTDRIIDKIDKMKYYLKTLSKKAIETSEDLQPTLLIVLENKQEVHNKNSKPFVVYRRQNRHMDLLFNYWLEQSMKDENIEILGIIKTPSAISLFNNMKDHLRVNDQIETHYSHFQLTDKITLNDFRDFIKEEAHKNVSEIENIKKLFVEYN